MTSSAPSVSRLVTILLRAWWMRRSVVSDMCNSLNSLSGFESSVSVIFAKILPPVPSWYEAHSTASMSMLNVFKAKALSGVDGWYLNSRWASLAANHKEVTHG